MPITPIFRDRANGSNFVFIATLVGRVAGKIVSTASGSNRFMHSIRIPALECPENYRLSCCKIALHRVRVNRSDFFVNRARAPAPAIALHFQL